MTRPDRHRIQRQVIEVAVGGASRGPALQEALARSYWERVVPELEAVFDRVAGSHETLRLDRLEIDLGRISGADWEPQFRRKLTAELGRKLAQFSTDQKTNETATQIVARSSKPQQQFLFFLTTGRLPWWASRPDGSWTDMLLKTEAAMDWSELRRVVRADGRARVRLIHSVSDGLLEIAVANWTGLQDAARVLERLAPGHISTRGGESAWRREFWLALLNGVLADGFDRRRGPELMRDLLRLRQSLKMGNEQGGAHGAGSGDAELSASDFEPRPERDSLPPPWDAWLANARGREAAQLLSSARQSQRSLELANGGSDSSAAREEHADRSARRAERPEPVYLSGAGVILLHPFLEELFRERGLLKGREFPDASSRQRAVHLLGLLVFGTPDTPEYDLTLAKLLCGVPFEEPLEPWEPDAEDHAACSALLNAVLKHWTALRSISPDWLRAQFLLREGKLEPVDEGWRLTVEHRAQDVLLARLPWGFGVIGLPWIKQKLFVHWLD
jgi:hypothetical protein